MDWKQRQQGFLESTRQWSLWWTWIASEPTSKVSEPSTEKFELENLERCDKLLKTIGKCATQRSYNVGKQGHRQIPKALRCSLNNRHIGAETKFHSRTAAASALTRAQDCAEYKLWALVSIIGTLAIPSKSPVRLKRDRPSSLWN